MKTIILVIALIAGSASAQYSYQTTLTGNAQRAGETNVFRLSVLKENRPVFTIERTLPFDVPAPLISLNEHSGMLVLRYVFDGFAEVYSSSGNKVWENNFFKDEEPNYERTLGAALGDSSIFFLLSDTKRERAVVQKFSLDGALQWTVQLPHQYAYDIALSPDERTILAGSYLALEDEVRQSTAILSSDGKIEGDINIIFRKAAFAQEQRLVALMSEREVVVISLDSKKEIGKVSKQRNQAIFTDLCWKGSELVVQESEVVTPADSRYYFANPTFTWYSQDMTKRKEQHIDGITFHQSRLVSVSAGIEFRYDGNIRLLQQ